MRCSYDDAREELNLSRSFSHGFFFAGIVGELESSLRGEYTPFESTGKLCDLLKKHRLPDEFTAITTPQNELPYWTFLSFVEKDLNELPELDLELQLLRADLENVASLSCKRRDELKTFFSQISDHYLAEIRRSRRSDFSAYGLTG